MDPVVLDQVVNAVWPLVAAGAVGRVGELGTERAVEVGGGLLARIGQRRRDRGLPEEPASPDELRDELRQLAATDEGAQAVQAVHNHFYGPVDARGANFGFQN
jgi:hypothetical protein